MKNVTVFLSFFLILCINAFAHDFQDITYKRWRFQTTQMVFRPAGIQPITGNYSIATKPMHGFKIGMEYVLKQDGAWQYYTGVNIHSFPLYHYILKFPGNEIDYSGEEFNEKIGKFAKKYHSVLSVPLGVLYEFKHEKNKVFFLKGGINIDFIRSGGVSNSYGLINDIGVDRVFFRMVMETYPKRIIYPSLFLGFGMHTYTNFAIFYLSINVQKSLMPYFTGGYEYANMNYSSNSWGTYTLRGLYRSRFRYYVEEI